MVRRVGRPETEVPSAERRLPRRDGRDFVVTKLPPPSATCCLFETSPALSLNIRVAGDTTTEAAIDFKARRARRKVSGATARAIERAGFFAPCPNCASRFLVFPPHLNYWLALRFRRMGNRQRVAKRVVLENGSRLCPSIPRDCYQPGRATGPWPPEGRRECKSLLATRSKPGLPANG